MDFAFAPGTGDPAITFLQTFYSSQPNVLFFGAAGLATVADFLGAAEAVTIIEPAPDNLLIGCHGDDQGRLAIALDSTNSSPTTYESLKKAQAANSIVIPPDVMTPSLKVRLASCQIGSDETLPVLTLLKQVMGNPKNIIAPRFIHAFAILPTGDAVESMLYTYRVLSKTALKTHDAVVGSFGNLTAPQVDGTPTPPENWALWVPKAALLNLNPSPNSGQQFPFDVLVNLVPPPIASLTSLNKDMGMWTAWCDGLPTINVTITGPIPTDLATQIAALKKALTENLDQFKDTNPFPAYKRIGYQTIDDMLAGFTWKITPSGNTLSYVGTRFRYELWVPVIKPGSNSELIFNYYPTGGGAAVTHFDDSNTPYKMFGIV
jgi:hypothetical protein